MLKETQIAAKTHNSTLPINRKLSEYLGIFVANATKIVVTAAEAPPRGFPLFSNK